MNLIVLLLTSFGATNSCASRGFFGLPTWYKYLVDAGKMAPNADTGRCEFVATFGVADLGLIALAVLDIVLRLAGLIAVGYTVYGGVQFVTSQGEPDLSKKARQTIINAIIGLIIALIAIGFVSFIGARLRN